MKIFLKERRMGERGKKKRSLAWFPVAVILALGSLAYSTELVTVSARQLVEQADLIFEGVVVNVAYRSSDVIDKGDTPVPHTFVTFRIENVYKGASPENSTITLRFTGGPTGNGRILMIPGVPLFDTGERSILFVKHNTKAICPLVGWKQGRFRIAEDLVYYDSGSEVLLSEEGNLAVGNFRPLGEVVNHSIGTLTVHVRRSDDTGESPQAGKIAGKKMTGKDFRAYLNTLVKTCVSLDKAQAFTPVKNADIKEKFAFRLKSVGPPKEAGKAKGGSD